MCVKVRSYFITWDVDECILSKESVAPKQKEKNDFNNFRAKYIYVGMKKNQN